MKQFQYFTTRYFMGLSFALLIGTSAFAQQKPIAPPAAPLRPSPKIVQVDRIVAVVNDQVITQNDLNDRLATVTRNLQKQGTELPPQETLTKQLLERMINDLIQVQLAKETGIKVDDAQLDKTMQQQHGFKIAKVQLGGKDVINWTSPLGGTNATHGWLDQLAFINFEGSAFNRLDAAIGDG